MYGQPLAPLMALQVPHLPHGPAATPLITPQVAEFLDACEQRNNNSLHSSSSSLAPGFASSTNIAVQGRLPYAHEAAGPSGHASPDEEGHVPTGGPEGHTSSSPAPAADVGVTSTQQGGSRSQPKKLFSLLTARLAQFQSLEGVLKKWRAGEGSLPPVQASSAAAVTIS